MPADTSGYPADFAKMLDEYNHRAFNLMARLQVGTISPSQWETYMAGLLTTFSETAWSLGSGGKDLFSDPHQEDLKQLSMWLDEQFKYLAGFASLIKASPEFNPAWTARAQMYGASTVTQYWEGRTADLPLPAMPGQGTQCLGNCHCSWDIKWIDEKKGDADCYWKLGAAEHCQTCQVRAEQWNPLSIRGGNLIDAVTPVAPPPEPEPVGPIVGYGVGKPPSVASLADPNIVGAAKKFLVNAPTLPGTTMHDSSDLKDKICKVLEKLTGLDYNKINNAVHQWAYSSNDTDMRSLFFQERASKIFKAPLSKWQKDQLKYVRENYKGGAEGWPLMGEGDTDSFLRSMYKYTQEELTRDGITTVILYRGTGLSDEEYRKFQNGKSSMKVSTNAMSSWSSARSTAESFASGAPNGVVLSMEVPATRIIGSARTGFGCWNEHEFVLLGSNQDIVDISDIQ